MKSAVCCWKQTLWVVAPRRDGTEDERGEAPYPRSVAPRGSSRTRGSTYSLCARCGKLQLANNKVWDFSTKSLTFTFEAGSIEQGKAEDWQTKLTEELGDVSDLTIHFSVHLVFFKKFVSFSILFILEVPWTRGEKTGHTGSTKWKLCCGRLLGAEYPLPGGDWCEKLLSNLNVKGEPIFLGKQANIASMCPAGVSRTTTSGNKWIGSCGVWNCRRCFVEMEQRVCDISWWRFASTGAMTIGCFFVGSFWKCVLNTTPLDPVSLSSNITLLHRGSTKLGVDSVHLAWKKIPRPYCPLGPVPGAQERSE